MKFCISLTLSLVFVVNSFGQNTITTGTLTQTSFCAGGDLIVQYTDSGSFAAGCVFRAELSDASGDFTNPVTVGSSPLDLGIIAGTIPTSTPFGVGYRVRVVATDPYTVGSASSTPIIITSTAVTATIVANPSSEFCSGDSISLWVTPNQAYYWSNGQTTQTINVKSGGTYTVRVTNYLTGCEITSEPLTVIEHPLPNPNFGPDRNLCTGQRITLNAGSGNASYLWNDGSNLQYKSISDSGTYSVTVTSVYGCVGGDTIRIRYHNYPVIEIGNDTSVCAVSYLLGVTPGYYSYNWNNGRSLNPTFLVDSSGVFYVAAANIYGCTTRDTIHLIMNPPPVIDLGNDLSVCGGGLMLDAGPGFAAYTWNGGLSSDRFLTVSASGVYTAEVISQQGCSGKDTIRIFVVPSPDIPLLAEYILQTNDSLCLNAGHGFSSYQWSTGQSTQAICLQGSDYETGQIHIRLTLTDTSGCAFIYNILLTIVASENINGFSIFPNPVRDYFQLTSERTLIGLRPVLSDISGKCIYPEFTASQTSMRIYCNGVAAGSYVLYMESDNGLMLAGKAVIY